MSNEGLGAIVYQVQDIGEGCSCERCELSGSWSPPISMTHEPVASPSSVSDAGGGADFKVHVRL
eukprot:2889657-Prymnesium_polylepis.1